MSTKQTLNQRKKTSTLDLKKLPQIGSSSLSLQLGIYFDSIFELTYKSMECLDMPYHSKVDPNFLVRVREVEWMFSAQVVFDLDDDTVFLAILIFDKILSRKKFGHQNVQKLARVALMLASKQNELALRLYKVNQISMVTLTKSEYIDFEAEVLDLFEFQLPSVTIYELFKLYQILFKLDKVLKKDTVNAALKRCVLDYELLLCGPKAATLAAITHLCCLQRILIDTSVIIDDCHYYTLALEAMNESAYQVKHKKRRANPQTQQVICV